MHGQCDTRVSVTLIIKIIRKFITRVQSSIKHESEAHGFVLLDHRGLV